MKPRVKSQLKVSSEFLKSILLQKVFRNGPYDFLHLHLIKLLKTRFCYSWYITIKTVDPELRNTTPNFHKNSPFISIYDSSCFAWTSNFWYITKCQSKIENIIANFYGGLTQSAESSSDKFVAFRSDFSKPEFALIA